ncbi:MAG: response regulator [Desulfuromonadales bacterium]|nr:response regulator [Desulfuromonadales bacterium]
MKRNILIVDDQPSLRQMLRFALTAHGYEVAEAEDGVDALDRLAKDSFDLLIVDWQMPRMDGLELIRQLRDQPAYALLPIVFISCWDNFDARAQARELGVLTWLKKPFRMSEIQIVVEGALGTAPVSDAKERAGVSLGRH